MDKNKPKLHDNRQPDQHTDLTQLPIPRPEHTVSILIQIMFRHKVVMYEYMKN